MAVAPLWLSSAAFAAAVLALGFAGVLLKRRSNSLYRNLAVVLGVSVTCPPETGPDRMLGIGLDLKKGRGAWVANDTHRSRSSASCGTSC
jgi:hypothetical protein